MWPGITPKLRLQPGKRQPYFKVLYLFVNLLQEDNPKTAQYPAFLNYVEVKTEVDQWLHEQQVQHILMQAPYSLTGYRVQVYRLGSTTQWFSAVITGHDLYTRVSVRNPVT